MQKGVKNIVTYMVNNGKMDSMEKQINKNHINLIVKDITQKYLLEATPRKGFIYIPNDYNQNLHKDEIKMAHWLHENIGGNITLMSEKNEPNLKTPDYLWNDRFWDLKTLTTERAADSAIRHGLKQISENPGGLILDYKGNELDKLKLAYVIEDRLSRGFVGFLDILVLRFGNIQFVKRYKKRQEVCPPANTGRGSNPQSLYHLKCYHDIVKKSIVRSRTAIIIVK